MKRRGLFASATMSALALGIARPAGAADLDVVIVGAGVAGLAAARSLMAAHKSVLVVEARERIGGRAVTDSTTFGFPFDQGAQWIEAGKTNPAMAILREANAKPILDRQEQTLYLAGKEPAREEYARFEKIAVDASRKIAAALKKPPPLSARGVTPGKEPVAWPTPWSGRSRRASRTTSCRRATSRASPTPSRNILWPRAWAP
jgi:monoamine oxidase